MAFGPVLPFWVLFQFFPLLFSLSSPFKDFFFSLILFVSPLYLGSIAYRCFIKSCNIWVRLLLLYIIWAFLTFVLGWTIVQLFAGASMAVADGSLTAAQTEMMAITNGISCMVNGHLFFVPWVIIMVLSLNRSKAIT